MVKKVEHTDANKEDNDFHGCMAQSRGTLSATKAHLCIQQLLLVSVISNNNKEKPKSQHNFYAHHSYFCVVCTEEHLSLSLDTNKTSTSSHGSCWSNFALSSNKVALVTWKIPPSPPQETYNIAVV